jgi:hypothetical protein
MPDITAETLVFGFIWYVAFLFSTTCHEASHALVAKLGGDDTAERGGQVTLNPVPHIVREPWGMVVIPILSFLFAQTMIGWASAPFNPEWERRYPRRAALMALAGPAANFTLMFLAAILIRFGREYHWFKPGLDGHPSLLGTILSVFFASNLLLAVFNFHGRQHRATLPGLAAHDAISKPGVARSDSWFPVFIWANRGFCHESVDLCEILINVRLRQLGTLGTPCFVARPSFSERSVQPPVRSVPCVLILWCSNTLIPAGSEFEVEISGPRTACPVAVSGWDHNEDFFVEKTELH